MNQADPSTGGTRPPTSPAEAAHRGEYRRSLAEQLAARIMPGPLLAVDKGGRVSRAVYYASLLLLEADPANHFVAERPEYAHASVGFRPSLRISPAYSQELRRRAKREADKAMQRAEQCLSPGQRVAMEKGYRHSIRWFHLTLTMRHPDGRRTFDEIKRLNAAFALLRKRDIWRKVHAGIKGIEDDLTCNGSHVHAHLMILSRWIDAAALRAAWHECLRAVSPDAGQEAPGNVDLKLIRERDRGETVDGLRVESRKAALDEVCKYITKTSNLVEPDEDGNYISGEQLLDLCDVIRWPRMFELLGYCRDTAATRQRRLDWIRPEYLTAEASGAVEEDEPWLGILAECAPDFINFWRIREDGEVETGVIEPDPPPKRTIRRASWRELMLRLRPEAWLERIEARATAAMERRRRFLERVTNGPVWNLQGC